jgi:flagellar biosynthetic protein FlhB
MYQSLSGIVRSGLWFDVRVASDTQVMLAVAVNSAFQGLAALLPVFGVLLVVAIFASVLLGGFLFSTKALEPKFERMNPLKGVTRMFSAQTLVELVKTLAKASVIGIVAVMVILHYKDQMVSLMHTTPTEALTSGLRLVALCCALIVGALFLIVMIDVPWQIFSHFKKMRMSRQDVRQEHKESDGDPHVKGRIRQQQRAMARRRMMSEVPNADVIVTNPTHFAVALVYKEGQGGAPKVVAKGTGLVAARIREIGVEHKVPMLSAPPLARALHHNVELGQEIPAELYSAVAEVLAWVFQLRSWNMGMGAEPRHPSSLPVPPGLDPQEKNRVATSAS